MDGSVELHRCTGRDDYFALVNGPGFTHRWMLEMHLSVLHAGEASFTVPGVCTTCARAADFRATFDGAWESPDGVRVPNWREGLACPTCGMNGRQRMIVALMTEAILGITRRPEPRVYLMEQVSPVYDWARATFPWLDLIGSEYLGGPLGPEIAARRATLRHEDAHCLTLADASVDVVVSCDVLEHVHDPARVFGEIARVLRPGGTALLTFPMDPHLDANRVRARLAGDRTEEILPAIYHGNPLSDRGALVFTDFGWEVLDQMRAAGLADPSLTVYWSYALGYLGIQFFFRATRPL